MVIDIAAKAEVQRVRDLVLNGPVLLWGQNRFHILVTAQAGEHSLFAGPALAGPTKGGTTNRDAAMFSYLGFH